MPSTLDDLSIVFGCMFKAVTDLKYKAVSWWNSRRVGEVKYIVLGIIAVSLMSFGVPMLNILGW